MVKNYNAIEYNAQRLKKISYICNPLFSNSCIKTFRYIRIFNNGKYMPLSTNHEWLCERVQIPNNGKALHEPLRAASEDKLTFYLWENNSSDILIKLFEKYNISNGVTAYKRKGASVEIWSFGATIVDPLASNFYINNLGFLRTFICYFTSVAGELIDISDKTKLANFDERVPIDFSPQSATFPSLTPACLSKNLDREILTQRQVECLRLISTGKTFKEAARFMSISPRTIEWYVNSIKYKLNTHSTSKIIDYFWKNFYYESSPNIS